MLAFRYGISFMPTGQVLSCGSEPFFVCATQMTKKTSPKNNKTELRHI